jgi:hypothetical protein
MDTEGQTTIYALSRRMERVFLSNAVFALPLFWGCHVPPDCEDTFMEAGDQVRVRVLGAKEPGSAGCGILELPPDTTFVRTVVGKTEPDPYDGCRGAKGEPDPSAPFAPIVSDCQQSSGLGFLCQHAELQEGCVGRMGMQLAIGTLSKSKPVTDDAFMNINWDGDECYSLGCQDQYTVRLEWIPKQ